jgi:tetratricopeptide (TPR) repeat protein
MALLFLLVQLFFLPGAASAFRLPKEALAVAGVLAILSIAVSARLRAGGLPVARGPLAATLAALPVLQAASALWGADPRRALASSAVTAVWIACAFWLAILDDGQRRRIAWLAAIGAGLSAIVLLVQAAGVPLIVVGSSPGSRFRLSGLAGNPADFATSAVLLLPFLLAAAPGRGRSWPRWLLAGLLAVAAVVSQTFTGYLALAAIAAVWLAGRRSPRLWLATAGVAVVALALALGSGLGDRVRRQLRQAELGDWYAVMSARSDGWTAAAEMALERPLVGVAAGHFTHAYFPSRLAWLEGRSATGRRGELATHFEWAHCDPLQLIAELGAFGGLWGLALVWALVRCRPRGDPLPLLAAAAVAPFLLLHYPTHLAAGTVPIVLALGHILAAQPAWRTPRLRGVWRVVIPSLLVATAVAGVAWQLHRLALAAWRAELERRLEQTNAAAEPLHRVQLASAVERQVLDRIERLPGAAPWLWRIAGKARLVRDDPRGAEQAFREAKALWPHEEAELGLGLALAAQGRRSEALLSLGSVCRVNPALARQLEDPDLRRAVKELNRARRKAQR